MAAKKIRTSRPQPAAPDWGVLDAHCVVGRHLRLEEGGLHTAADLLGEMDHFGIAEAMVQDCLGRENHPQEGNARVLLGR